MTEHSLWIVAAAVAVFVAPPFIYVVNERRLRRRERALAGRRKTKMRL